MNPPANSSMFFRLWWRAVSVKRSQAALAMASVLVGAAVASLLLNLYQDVQRKMTQEIRAYGANVIVSPGASSEGNAAAPAEVMAQETIDRVEAALPHAQGSLAVPVLYAIVRLRRSTPDPRLPEFENVVAVGTDFSRLHSLNAGWHQSGASGQQMASGAGGCVVGARVASRLRVNPGDRLTLEPLRSELGGGEVKDAACRISSVLTTGATEDDQVFFPLADLQSLAGLDRKTSVIELNLPGDTAEVEQVVRELARRLPGLDVRPIRQIVYSEGQVLGTIRWLLVSLTGLILLIISLCVAATMTAIVLERRKDIAVMKALGASERMVKQLFLAEGASLGFAGGIAGFALGALLASELARRLFAVELAVSWWTLPVICLAAMLLAVVATLFPARIVSWVQPAIALKGE